MKTIQVLSTVTSDIDFEAATYVVASYSQLDLDTKEAIFACLSNNKAKETLAFKISKHCPNEVAACLAYKGNSLVGWALKKKGETSLLAGKVTTKCNNVGVEVAAALTKFKDA